MDAKAAIENELTRARKPISAKAPFEKRVGCTPYSGKVWGKNARMLIAGVAPKDQGLKESLVGYKPCPECGGGMTNKSPDGGNYRGSIRCTECQHIMCGIHHRIVEEVCVKCKSSYAIIEAAVVQETPVGDYTTVGDFEKGKSFRHPVDRKLITHPAVVNRVKTKFAASLEQVFDLYFINMNARVANAWLESGEITDTKRLFAPAGNRFDGEGLGLDPNVVKLIPDHITVLYINNTAVPHEPMTPWIMAHRFGHAVRRQPIYDEYQKYAFRYLTQIADRALGSDHQYSYGGSDDRDTQNARKKALTLRLLCQQLGTFKSARDKKLRDQYEFLHECMAQFLLTGKVRFNRIGSKVHTGYTYGKPNYQHGAHNADELIGRFEEGVNNYCYSVIEACEGKCFVM